MEYKSIFVAFLVSSVLAFPTFSNTVKVLAPQSQEDVSHGYFIELLSLILTKSAPKYPATTVEVLGEGEITHGRTLRLLSDNLIDVFWSGTNIQREKDLLPIRIPIFKGLLGYRVLLIHKSNHEKFIGITKKELQSLIACQGEHWPDSDIFEDNHFQVARIARFDLMFKILNQRRCDYFPRSIFEGYAELISAQRLYPNLMMFDDVILQYDFPMYYFVNRGNPALAAQIEYGFIQANSDGSLQELMSRHAVTKGLFPLSQWQNKKYIYLFNNYLPPLTPINDNNLWFRLYE
jgi:hypothetical protein